MFPQVFGKYVLERELARGGMARVLLATLRGADGFEKRLVVKQIRDELSLDEEFVRRFVTEAKTTVALSHPNIVPVYELGVELGTYFLAMELVEGASVAEILRAGGPLSPEEGAYVGIEVCRALDYAHRRMKVVHRDVTPRNVLIDEEGQVKVIDFGIAAPASAERHEVFGSPGHMPPEQIEGKELTPAADIFAVAVLLTEAWTGKAPFRRRTVKESEAAMAAPAPSPGDTDARLVPLDDVVKRAMALDPLARPQAAEDFGRALRKFLVGVDLGDVARHLGERVREARRAPPAPAETKKLERPPSRPQAVEIATRTFAAREEVSVWQSAPPPADGATRRLASSEAPGSSIEQLATGRMASDTLATRPIETGRRANDPSRRVTWPWAIVVGAVALAIGGIVLGKQVAARGGGGPATVVATPPPTVPPTAVSVAVPPSAATEETPEPVPEKARITAFGNPGTVVSIDGVPRGACPVRDIAVPPGAHTVAFTFNPTGESRAETVSVKPGTRVTLRADFTGASPTVRVQR